MIVLSGNDIMNTQCYYMPPFGQSIRRDWRYTIDSLMLANVPLSVIDTAWHSITGCTNIFHSVKVLSAAIGLKTETDTDFIRISKTGRYGSAINRLIQKRNHLPDPWILY